MGQSGPGSNVNIGVLLNCPISRTRAPLSDAVLAILKTSFLSWRGEMGLRSRQGI